MSNAKGNVYPLWMISNAYQVQSVDKEQKVTDQSHTGFAIDIGISEDGTVWILSNEADPDGGGAQIYWSNGDNKWNKIDTSDPGGVKICGYTGNSCLFLSSSGVLCSMDTDGSYSTLFDSAMSPIIDFDYGGGKIWALMYHDLKSYPNLHYTEASSINWQQIGDSKKPVNLRSLSVNHSGFCNAVNEKGEPVYYNTNGDEGSVGKMGKKLAEKITYKNHCFVLSTDTNDEGNLILEWEDVSGGTFSPTHLRANSICGSYYYHAPS